MIVVVMATTSQSFRQNMRLVPTAKGEPPGHCGVRWRGASPGPGAMGSGSGEDDQNLRRLKSSRMPLQARGAAKQGSDCNSSKHNAALVLRSTAYLESGYDGECCNLPYSKASPNGHSPRSFHQSSEERGIECPCVPTQAAGCLMFWVRWRKTDERWFILGNRSGLRACEI